MSDRTEPANSSHRAPAAAAATLVALTFGLSPQNAPGTMQAVPAPVGSPTSSPAAATAEAVDQLAEIMVQTREPRYVAATRRDQIGRIWAPVLINGRGPFRLVLDTGASSSGVTAMVAMALGISTDGSPHVTLRGVTGSADVPTIKADTLTVGDLAVDSPRCEKAQDGWEVQVEVLETKGRLADNDILASFVLRLDADGDLDSYQRVRRYTRSGASILAA